MNIDDIEVGDYVETSDGFVLEVVSKKEGYVALKGRERTFWTTHNKIIRVRNEY